MLFLAHADRGEVASNLVPVSLRQETQEVLAYVEATLEDGHHRVDVEGDALARVNPSLVRSARINLLLNASRYTAPGKAIVVRLSGVRSNSAGCSVQSG